VNAGICIENNMLYLVAKNKGSEKPSFYKSNIRLSISYKDEPGGYIWDRIENEELKSVFMQADSIALVIPARICFSKKINVDSNLDRNRKEYKAWIAHNQLPGKISDYIYGFIPLVEDRTSNKIETLFYATLSEQFHPLFYAVVDDEDRDRIRLVPEYMSLAVILLNAINTGSDIQAAIINSGESGTAAVLIKRGSIYSTRYFPLQTGKWGELASALEAYFLSMFDSNKQTEIFVAGGKGLRVFKPDFKAKIRFNKMPVGFISALGSVEYISAGGRCELPAGS